jgi:hypothetical protein
MEEPATQHDGRHLVGNVASACGLDSIAVVTARHTRHGDFAVGDSAPFPPEMS